MTESSSYRLNESQQQVWRTQIGKPPRGGQTKIARALKKALRQTDATWKNALTDFFKGEKDGLKKIFDDPTALSIVAKELDRAPDELRAALRTAAGVATEDSWLEVRVPGFEDLGPVPVLDAFFAPERGEVRWWQPSSQVIRNENGGQLELTPLVEAVANKRSDAPLAIVFVADVGLGRTPTLKALAAELVALEGRVVVWPDRPTDSESIVFVDALERIEPPERARLMTAVHQARATLIATTSARDPLDDLPSEQIIARIQPSHPWWGVRYLEHLERVLSERGYSVKLQGLREWLEDDPYASSLGSRVDTLGILARHVMDGGGLPVRHADVLQLSLSRWERLLRQRGLGPTAQVLRQCGARALGRVVLGGLRSGSEAFTAAELSRAFLAEAIGLAGSDHVPWAGLGAPGMLTVVEELTQVGMLHQEGDTTRLAQVSLGAALLGRELARHLDDSELVRTIVLDPGRHDALLVAAEELGDPCPLISAIDRQPAGVRCMAFPALTRLLSASPAPSNVDQLDDAFRRCLRWWAHWPASPVTRTLTLGGAYRPERSSPEYQRIANLSPLIAMGLASKRHQRALRPVDVDTVLGTPLGPTIEGYLEIVGRSQVSREDARVALFVGAPFQAKEILDASLWRELPPLDFERVVGQRRVLNDEDYWFWWRLVAAPRLEKERDGKARIAGITGGMSIASALHTTKRGVSFWRDALSSRILAGDAGAPKAFGEAVALTLKRGNPPQGRAMVELWGTIPEERRAVLRSAALAAMPDQPEDWRFTDGEWMTWLLAEIVDDEHRRAWWQAWSSDPSYMSNIPWFSFYEDGYPVEEIVEWAVRTFPQEEIGVFPDSEVRPQVAVLNHFIASDDADALAALVRVHDWPELRQKALLQLCKVDPMRSRRVVLEVAEQLTGDDRLAWLRFVQPQQGEDAYWQAFADTACDLPERLIRLAQTDCAAEHAGGWVRTRAMLILLDCLFGPSQALPESVSSFRETLGAWAPLAERSFEQLRRELDARLPAVLGHIGGTLFHARMVGRTGIDDLVRLAFGSEHIRARIFEGQVWWWVLASFELGEDFAIGMLEGAHAQRADDASMREVLHFLCQHTDLQPLVLRAAAHPALRDVAAPIAAALTLRSRHAVAQGVLAELPLLDGAGEPARCTTLWLQHWAEVDGDAAVRWLRGALREQSPSARRAWWRRMVELVPPGSARADAVEEWGACPNEPPSGDARRRSRGPRRR